MKLRIILPALLASTSMLSMTAYADTQNASGFTAQQQTQIQNIVHEYLVKNPQILVEVANALQQQQTQQQNQAGLQALPANAQALFYAPNSPVLGNPKGDVTLVEFFDYQCPHCKNVAPSINKLISDDSNVRVVFKQLPIFGANSEFAARAALAVNELYKDKFVAFHNALMNADNPLTQDVVLTIAKNLGLDTQKLQDTMNNDKISNEIDQNTKLAQALNFPGTPAFVIAKVPATLDKYSTPPTKAFFIPGEASEQDLQNFVTQASGS